MADLSIQVGSRSEQGVRPNNEDRFVVDPQLCLFLVADGMGGQDRGEQASGMAADIIPQVVRERLQAKEAPERVLVKALETANQAIVQAGRSQPAGRRMGTTAVVAVQQGDKVYVTGLGDSRAYLIRGNQVEQLTVDHSVAQALVASGVLSPEEARHSPWQHVLHKFLGCAELTDSPEVRPFKPRAGDRLVIGSDGLTNFVTDEDLREGARQFQDAQAWADHLVQTALQRGSRDNVTCVVVAWK